MISFTIHLVEALALQLQNLLQGVWSFEPSQVGHKKLQFKSSKKSREMIAVQHLVTGHLRFRILFQESSIMINPNTLVMTYPDFK